MHRSKVNVHIEQGASAIHALQSGSTMHRSRQLFGTWSFFDQVCYQQNGQVATLFGSDMNCQQSGQWPSSAFLRSIHPYSKIATVTQAGRWDLMQLPPTQVRWNICQKHHQLLHWLCSDVHLRLLTNELGGRRVLRPTGSQITLRAKTFGGVMVLCRTYVSAFTHGNAVPWNPGNILQLQRC